MQRRGYFALQDHALIAMLRDDNENVGVAKMLERCKQVVEESVNNDDCPFALISSLLRLFNVPTTNAELESKCFIRICQFQFLPAKASNNC